MNVLNRKMFANRDARRKLANMGGILASSPELMNTAQMFANGGPAVVKTKTVIVGDPLGGVRYDLYSDGSAIMLSTGRRIDPSNASNVPLLQMLQTLPDVTNTSISQPPAIVDPKLDSAPITENETGIGSGFPKIPDSRKAKDKFFRGELADQIRSEGLPSIATPDDENPMIKLIEAGIDKVTTPFKPDTTNNPPNPYQGDIDAAVESFVAPELLDLNLADIAGSANAVLSGKSEGQDESGSTLSGNNFTQSPDEGYSYPTDSPKVIEQKKKTNDKEVEIAKDADVETADVEEPGQRGFTPGQGDDTISALEEIATGEGTSEQKVEKIRKEVFGPGVDSKTAIAQYQTKFNDILGEDRDLNEEKWHTLAMIGFAIAAGEDSNALTNIANGLLEGTKMAREDRATRQARKDKINMLALEQFFADERLAKEIQGRKDVAQIAADARTADDTWFSTAQGKNAIRAYNDIFGTQNVSMKEEDKMPAFVKRVGEESATIFFTLMQIPREVAPTDTRTLDDIPD